MTTNAEEIKKDDTVEYYGKLYVNKLDNPEKMEKFLGAHNLPRLSHEKLEILHRPITSKDYIINQNPLNSETLKTRWLHWRIPPNN